MATPSVWSAKGRGKVKPREGRVVVVEPAAAPDGAGVASPGGTLATTLPAGRVTVTSTDALGRPPTAPIQLDALSYEDRQLGCRPGDPPPRYDRASLTEGGERRVPKLRVDVPAEWAAARGRARDGLPVVLRGAGVVAAAKPGGEKPALVNKVRVGAVHRYASTRRP